MPTPIVERPGMASYGVPADLDGTLPGEWARERLVPCRNYWVVTVDARQRPHSLPVWGVWREDDTFAFSCSPVSQKWRNLSRNPWVNVSPGDSVEVVSVRGTARQLSVEEDAALIDAIVAEYVSKYEQHLGGSTTAEEFATFVRSHAIATVRPEVAFGVIEREDEFSQRATRWRWPDAG